MKVFIVNEGNQKDLFFRLMSKEIIKKVEKEKTDYIMSISKV